MKAFNTLLEAVANPGEAPGQLGLDLSTVVPAGKQLVVEFVSTSSEMPPGQKAHLTILIIDTGGSAAVQHYPVTQFQLNYRSVDIYKSADPMHMRVPHNRTLRQILARDGSDGTARRNFGISSHFETA